MFGFCINNSSSIALIWRITFWKNTSDWTILHKPLTKWFLSGVCPTGIHLFMFLEISELCQAVILIQKEAMLEFGHLQWCIIWSAFGSSLFTIELKGSNTTAFNVRGSSCLRYAGVTFELRLGSVTCSLDNRSFEFESVEDVLNNLRPGPWPEVEWS